MSLTSLQVRQLNNMNAAAQRAQLGTLMGNVDPYVQKIFVDPFNGDDAQAFAGESWGTAFATMTSALAAVETGGEIHFTGDVDEVCVGSNLVFDVSIIGHGSLHHPDQPTSAYNPAGAMWRNTAGDTAALLEVKGRGWNFINIAFDSPASYAAVKLTRNALSGVAEFDASHASFVGCRFLAGKYGIEDNGGCYNVTVEGCVFTGMTTSAIANTSASVSNPLQWKIFDNQFPSYSNTTLGNATHIDSPFSQAIIARNFFGTAISTAKYVDLTGGNGNIVTANFMMGVFQAVDYTSATGDSWVGNQTIDLSRGSETNAAGMSIALPA